MYSTPLRRSHPVLPLAFFAVNKVEDEEDDEQLTIPVDLSAAAAAPPLESSHQQRSSLGGVQTLGTTQWSVTDLTDWQTSWGPGQRLAAKSRNITSIFSRSSLRPQGGFLEALRTLRRVSKPLRTQRLRDVRKAGSALGALQDAAGDPYPPRNLTPIDTTSTAGFQLIDEIRFFFSVCISAYPPQHVSKHYGIKLQARTMPETVREFLTGKASGSNDEAVIVDYLDKADVHRPAYCLAVDNIRQLILLVIRGSAQFSDVATDVQCEVVTETRTHDGMGRAAAWFDDHLCPTVTFLANLHPTYPIRLIGHSLGGGVASLLTMRWLHKTAIAGPAPNRPRLKAYSYGAPAICTPDLAASFRSHITSVSCGRDIIARLSYGSVVNMTNMLLSMCQILKYGAPGDTVPTIKEALHRKERTQGLFTAFTHAKDYVEQAFHEQASLVQHTHARIANKFTTPATDEDSIDEDAEYRRFGGPRLETFPENECESPTPSDCSIPQVKHEKTPTSPKRHLRDVMAHGVQGVKANFAMFIKSNRSQEQFRAVLQEIRKVKDQTDRTILCPAGQWYLFVPAVHFLMAGLPPPVHLLPGGFAMFNASEHVLNICDEMIFVRRAVHDHYPTYINFALGNPLGMTMPEPMAGEMEGAIDLGVDVQVRPEWQLPHLGLMHRHLRNRQLAWHVNADPKPVRPVLLTRHPRAAPSPPSSPQRLDTQSTVPSTPHPPEDKDSIRTTEHLDPHQTKGCVCWSPRRRL